MSHQDGLRHRDGEGAFCTRSTSMHSAEDSTFDLLYVSTRVGMQQSCRSSLQPHPP